MLNYKGWKTLQESIGSHFLGTTTIPTIGIVSDVPGVVDIEEAKKKIKLDEPKPEVMADDEVVHDEENDECKCKACKVDCTCKEDSYYGSGLESFFCTCKSPKVDNGVCVSCHKNVLQESYTGFEIYDDLLNNYSKFDGPLLELAGSICKHSNVSDTLIESAKEEVENILMEAANNKNTDKITKIEFLKVKLARFSR